MDIGSIIKISQLIRDSLRDVKEDGLIDKWYIGPPRFYEEFNIDQGTAIVFVALVPAAEKNRELSVAIITRLSERLSALGEEQDPAINIMPYIPEISLIPLHKMPPCESTPLLLSTGGQNAVGKQLPSAEVGIPLEDVETFPKDTKLADIFKPRYA